MNNKKHTFIEKCLERCLSLHFDIPDYMNKSSKFRHLVILRNFLRRNALIRRYYRWDERKKNRGLSIFVIRQAKPGIGIPEMIIEYIKKNGFKIIHIKELSRSYVDHFAYNPGGVHQFWGSGYPYICVVVFDPKPLKMYVALGQHWRYWTLRKQDLEKKYYYKMFPNMDNRRLLIKNDVRTTLNMIHPEAMQDESYLHSTDNVEEAIEYIDLTMPDMKSKILDWVYNNYQDFLSSECCSSK